KHKSPGNPGFFVADDDALTTGPVADGSSHCNPVGLLVDPIGVIVPPVPLLEKRLFVYEATVPDTPTLLKDRSLLDRLTPPPVCLMPIALKAIVVPSMFSPPPVTDTPAVALYDKSELLT